MANYGLSYSEMLTFKTFDERLNYLRLSDKINESPRTMSNPFYHDPRWRACREAVILRDLGSEFGLMGYDITGNIIVHHINPLTEYDIENDLYKLFDPENLISVSIPVHNEIHYGKPKIEFIERTPGDTKLW